jgi:hypothetical protein
MADKEYRVSWKAGEIRVHASSEGSAINVGIEYIRVADTKRIVAEECPSRVELERETAEAPTTE